MEINREIGKILGIVLVCVYIGLIFSSVLIGSANAISDNLASQDPLIYRDKIVNFAINQIGAHYVFGAHGNLYPDDFGKDEGSFWDAEKKYWKFETTKAVYDIYNYLPDVYRTGKGTPEDPFRYWQNCQGYGGGKRTGCIGKPHYDCIGLVDTAYRKAGVYDDVIVYTVTYWLDHKHLADVKKEDLQPGDLAYVGTTHIGLYIGENKVVHSTYPAGGPRGVVCDSFSEYNEWTRFGRALPIVQAEIDILNPTQSAPASAGAYDNPNHIDVKVEVKEGENPITGLTNADFSFKIGEKSATASLTDDSTPGRYVFDVTPPHQDAAGKYDFEVTLTYNGCTFGDREEERRRSSNLYC
jgi:cell wall-associated NlpC family hydrolase